MKISEYLVDRNGKPSSARMMAYRLLIFFMAFNLIMFPLLAYLKADINWVIAIMGYDFMILLAIFTPKQLGKIEEVKEVIGLAKTTLTDKKEKD